MRMGARGALPLLVVLMAMAGCDGGRIRGRPSTPPPGPTCGDGQVDSGEECDGSNLAGQSCSAMGFEAGSLICNAQCKWDTAQCTRRCGNGQLDSGEACDGTLGPLACGSWGYKSCGTTCQVEAASCVTQAFAARQDVVLAEGGPALLTDLPPTAGGELVVAVRDYRDSGSGRLTLRRWVHGQGFTSESVVGSQDPTEVVTPAWVLAADLDGDGVTDLAAMNADSSVDRYVYVIAEAKYERTRLWPTEGCTTASDFVGTLPGPEGMGRLLVAYGCPTGDEAAPHQQLVLIPAEEGGTSRALEAAGMAAAVVADLDGDGSEELAWLRPDVATLLTWTRTGEDWAGGAEYSLPFKARRLAAGDLDGDGLTDVAISDGTRVALLQNTGTGLASARELPGSGTFLTLTDVDGDGRRDVLWVDGASVQLARNQGDFTFATQALEGAPGTPLSLSTGDADGDGDVDLAVTYSDAVGPRASRTGLFLNQVK